VIDNFKGRVRPIIETTLTRTAIQVVRDEAALPEGLSRDRLARFLHEVMKPYEDTLADIKSALSIALEDENGPGGFAVLGMDEDELIGAAVILRTPWSGYVPENMLLFIGVEPQHRGQGLGRALIEEALDHCEGDVKLHVEYDNPAKRLYERVGFTSKYAEMRYTR
jgi:[ribosomal protein S18]-alanine N-acetyltransferase